MTKSPHCGTAFRACRPCGVFEPSLFGRLWLNYPLNDFGDFVVPAPMNGPPVDDLTSRNDVIVCMLRGGQAGVIREYAHAGADRKLLDHPLVGNHDCAVLLRERADGHSKIMSLEIQDTTVACCRIELQRPLIF